MRADAADGLAHETVQVISEAESRRLITRPLALQAAREALAAAASGGVLFPASILHGASPANRISMKAGVVAGVAGVKLGSYWPGNTDIGLPRHGSLILLFDEGTGRVDTVIQASMANALRTAAANAVAVDTLARRNARVLAVFGAGAQAIHEVLALSDVRTIERVLIVSDNADKAAALIQALNANNIAAERASPRQACELADIIVTVTPSRAPLFDAQWVRPGAHISAMGADGPGKQELPLAILRSAQLFCDLPSQSVVLGEFQSIAAEVASGDLRLTSIGSVIDGRHPGRADDRAITIFDSSGIALQDIALGLHLKRAWLEQSGAKTWARALAGLA